MTTADQRHEYRGRKSFQMRINYWFVQRAPPAHRLTQPAPSLEVFRLFGRQGYSFVRSLLPARVQPTLDPSAETLRSSNALAHGEEGNW